MRARVSGATSEDRALLAREPEQGVADRGAEALRREERVGEGSQRGDPRREVVERVGEGGAERARTNDTGEVRSDRRRGPAGRDVDGKVRRAARTDRDREQVDGDRQVVLDRAVAPLRDARLSDRPDRTGDEGAQPRREV